MVIALPTTAPAAGFFPAAGVVAVARQGSADHNDQASVCVDDHLMGRGTAAVVGLFADRVVAGGHQRPVHDEHRVVREPLARLLGPLPEMLIDSIGSKYFSGSKYLS